MIKDHFIKKRDDEDWGKSIVFYCKDCEKLVDVQKIGKKYVYKCKICGTKNVAFGTSNSIYSFFHIEENPDVQKSPPPQQVNDVQNPAKV